jgi:Mrp family chromosome partitioning ATPase
MGSALRELAGTDVDYVLIDAPPILSVGDAAALSSSVDAILLVANLDKVNQPTLADGREQLEPLPCRKVGVVVVGERIDNRQYYGYAKSRG